jgi:hypothetical protein
LPSLEVGVGAALPIALREGLCPPGSTDQSRPDATLEQFAAASASNLNFSDYRFAVALISVGKPETAVEVLRAHMRLDPFYTPIASAWLGFAYYMLERYKEALPPLRQCISRSPNQRVRRT